MIKIKVSTPWDHIDFNTRISPELKKTYHFDFDRKENEQYDFWIVWGGLKEKKENAICNPNNVIYLTDEVHEQRFFNKAFLQQFQSIITCRKDIPYNSVFNTHELNTWMIQKSYEELLYVSTLPKTRILSVICSDLVWLPGHKVRYAFVNKLIGHFKDKIDVFGRGFKQIADKYEALEPYKYSVAIENSSIPGYFTEKITDCYISHVLPVYYGCPDINKYFDSNSYLAIDPNDDKASFRKIEQLIEEDPYESLLPLIIDQKLKYLNEYHIFNKLVSILDEKFSLNGIKHMVTLKNEFCFQRGYHLNSMIDATFRKLHLPGRLYFQLKMDQSSSYANSGRN